jgi:hypothetical protein
MADAPPETVDPSGYPKVLFSDNFLDEEQG